MPRVVAQDPHDPRVPYEAVAHDTPIDLLSAGERPLVHSSIRALAHLAGKTDNLPDDLHFIANEAAHELQHAGWQPDEGEDQQMYWPTPDELKAKIDQRSVDIARANGHDPKYMGKAPLRLGDAGLMDACATYVWAAEQGLL